MFGAEQELVLTDQDLKKVVRLVYDRSGITLHEGYDPTHRLAAMAYLQQRHAGGEVVTGLLHINESSRDLNERMNTVDAPLNSLGEMELCPLNTGKAPHVRRKGHLNSAKILAVPGNST